MRILYLCQYFPPEIGATQTRAYEMARGLVQAGHRVTMVTEFPNHPVGVIPSSYRGKLFERETVDGVDVVRVWVMASPRKTIGRRMLFYLSFMFMAIVASLVHCRGSYDVIYATSPPLFVGGAGLALSYLKRRPLVFEVRDLWPESAVVLGQLHNQRFIRWATWLEVSCYKRARAIVVTAREIYNRLIERGQAADKVTIIRNGANIELFRPNTEQGRQLREKMGLSDNFVLLYPGLHGLAYDLEFLMDAMQQLAGCADIHLLMVGDGPTKGRALARVEQLGLTNVTFLAGQPQGEIPAFFNAADVTLVPLRQPQIAGMFPVKVYDSLACSTPVIVCAKGEIRRVVEESEAGLATDPGDMEALVGAILALRAEPELRQQLGANGRIAVVASYSRQAQAGQLANLLDRTLNHQRST